MSRVYNFSAGPAAIPTAVLDRARDELLDWQGLGLSVMEISHRSKYFLELVRSIEAKLRELLVVPANYKVLFMAGGASYQFAAIPLNFLGQNNNADYIDTGIWSHKAIVEAQRFGHINIAASSAPSYTYIPAPAAWQLNPDAAYVHYAANETIGGVEFFSVPEVGEVPLVVDMSSNILSRPIDVSRFGLIYAGAQKNIGPSGISLVIVREDLLGKAQACTPSLFNYQNYAEHDSMPNTPPTFSWYLIGLVLDWLKEQGGLTAMAVANQRKAAKLYCCIDNSSLYRNTVEVSCRSVMNVPFYLNNPELESRFLDEATAQGLTNLKGHKLVGGIRASIYNAMPEAGVDALIAFMRDFERRYG